ncbi:LOW QUALITY PROTEIN: hypothetical protein CVT25_009048 [Psilocybe cyanescens]|uniref:Protein ZIP4 homolog n=1 Tax=Psilocybe cyanescens TaxID=93625 RepID=A0A409X2W1_PSICY|nr:LOW QUALITY PROTEIN: hypothetical protein CVT25_009048 [Psilocybe cyanescens]
MSPEQSSRKKESAKSLQEIHASILELLSTVKVLLDEPKNTHRASLNEKLIRVASLAESFTEQRPKSNKTTWTHLADSLDQEGVNLWNISGLIHKAPDEVGQTHVTTLRLAAFRLVEAGLEMKPGIESRCFCSAMAILMVSQLKLPYSIDPRTPPSEQDRHVSIWYGSHYRVTDVTMLYWDASNAALPPTESGQNVLAVGVLTSAAKFEEQLRNVDDLEDTQRRSIACATVVYYSSRMEARELLAYKLHQIAGSFLTTAQSGSKTADAIQWLQRAFSVADQLEDATTYGVTGLKVFSPLCVQFHYLTRFTPARAYFISEAYDRAESVLDELIPIIEASNDHTTSEYQELRWLRLSVLKKRNAGDASLLNAFKSIIDHMEFSELNITEFGVHLSFRDSVTQLLFVLQDLRTFNHHYTLVTAVHQHTLGQCLERHKAEPDHIHRLILSLIIHSSKDEDHTRAMKTLDSTFTSVCDADVELPRVISTACLTLIWQYGSRHYKSKKWSEAAEWFMAGSHSLFRVNSPLTSAKCFRKVALCHIEQGEYLLASTVIRRCSTAEASTHYIIFLTAIHQAIRAVQDMLKAPDFDRKMLLVATQISHQSEMKPVLLVVLESLLKTLNIGSNGEIVVEAMTLMRCIVKLVFNLLLEPAANKPVLIDIVVKQFRTARILTEAAVSQKVVSLVFKDISWLWRTAYNCAVQGCAEWENAGDQISELFDIARELLDCCCQASPVEIDAELCLHLANASFAAVSGRGRCNGMLPSMLLTHTNLNPQVFSAREVMTTTGAIDVSRTAYRVQLSLSNFVLPHQEEHMRAVLAQINKAMSKINDISCRKNVQETRDSDRIQHFLHALRVFQAEFSAHLKDWDKLSQNVDEIANSGPLAFGTYEAIADILLVGPSSFVQVLRGAVILLRTDNLVPMCHDADLMPIAILRASLHHSSLSVEKFSRWLRAICTISLSRDTTLDRQKAIGYVEHAVSVMEDHHEGEGEVYPMDERQWLLATAYNTGTECLHASMLDEAKRWFEVSTVICRFVPGGKQRSEKVRASCLHLANASHRAFVDNCHNSIPRFRKPTVIYYLDMGIKLQTLERSLVLWFRDKRWSDYFLDVDHDVLLDSLRSL